MRDVVLVTEGPAELRRDLGIAEMGDPLVDGREKQNRHRHCTPFVTCRAEFTGLVRAPTVAADRQIVVDPRLGAVGGVSGVRVGVDADYLAFRTAMFPSVGEEVKPAEGYGLLIYGVGLEGL